MHSSSVVGCDYTQTNHRVPDLKRHAGTHDQWMEPDKWTRCSVAMDRAHSHNTGIEEGMTEGTISRRCCQIFSPRAHQKRCPRNGEFRHILIRDADTRMHHGESTVGSRLNQMHRIRRVVSQTVYGALRPSWPSRVQFSGCDGSG